MVLPKLAWTSAHRPADICRLAASGVIAHQGFIVIKTSVTGKLSFANGC